MFVKPVKIPIFLTVSIRISNLFINLSALTLKVGFVWLAIGFVYALITTKDLGKNRLLWMGCNYDPWEWF